MSLALTFPEELFYRILSDKSGMVIRTDGELLQQLAELAKVKREYEKVSDALSAVMATGYGVVMPSAEEMNLEKPEVIRKGSSYGIKLQADAPSIHMIQANVETEIAPIVGTKEQAEDLINYILEL